MKSIFKSKADFILFFVLSFSVVVDALNGYLQDANGSSNIGVVYRGLILVWGAKYVFNTPCKGLIKVILLTLFLDILFLSFTGVFDMLTFSMAFKIIFPYFLMGVLFKYRKTNKIINFSLINGILIALILIYCFINKIGFASYGESYYGTKGFFIAMNDVGLSLLIADCLACYQYLYERKNIYLFYICVISAACCLLGSMAGFGGVSFVLFFLFLCVAVLRFSDYKATQTQRTIAIIVIWMFLLPTLTYFVNIIQNDNYLVEKYSNIQKTIFENSGRAFLAKAANKVISAFNIPEYLFGIGSSFQMKVGNVLHMGAGKGVEIDFYDIFGTFGIIFAVLVYIIPLIALIKSIKYYFTTKKVFFIWSSLAFLLYVVHSIYGGHAYTSPMASTLMVVFVYLLYNRIGKDSLV